MIDESLKNDTPFGIVSKNNGSVDSVGCSLKVTKIIKHYESGEYDLIATGGTAEAAAKLIEISKGKVAAFIFVINLFDLGGCENLLKNGYKVENLMDFPGH